MPILSVKALPQVDHSRIKRALKETCLAISKVYGCAPNQVWATWQVIEPGLYVEGNNEGLALEQPLETHPPICELLCFEGKSQQQIEETLQVASSTLSELLGVGNNIFMTYREAKSGQVIAGNGIIRI